MTITLRYPATCAACAARLQPGERADWYPRSKSVYGRTCHAAPQRAATPTPAPLADEPAVDDDAPVPPPPAPRPAPPSPAAVSMAQRLQRTIDRTNGRRAQSTTAAVDAMLDRLFA